eukprot:CAMPEP_0116136932 /NCGR_PEP_ID=MMETSP0329-20121206/11993_1 /TAXON_ID=697910 /ORGANISM="Pseudo-nitzschia arenysensis, Strain B593" /LENGTH=832 /DNA_ID=CAMNT_0003631843 /DNA_START=315 /DNA_END=2813 /DNA_ORIENTATION=-
MNSSIPDGSGHDGNASEDMATKAGAAGPPPTQLPKCFCNWRFCRTYQKAFREFKHPFYNGVIKLKFYENDPRSMALKESIDRTLNVESTKRNDWKEAVNSDGTTSSYCRYYVARHHFTENLMTHYLNDRRSWDWNEPLPEDEAEEFLYSLDPQDIYDEDQAEGCRYVQTPNVPKDHVRELLKRLKDMRSESQRNNGTSSQQSQSKPRKVPLASQDEMARSQPNDLDASTRSNGQPKTQKRSNNSSSTHITAKSTVTKNEEEIVIESEDYDTDDEEYEENEVEGTNGHRNYKDNTTRTRNSYNSTSKRKQTKEDESSTASSTVALLAQKEEENVRLRDDLNDCKKQINMLQSVVAKLQVRLDLDDNDGNNGASEGLSDRKSRQNKSTEAAKNATRDTNPRVKQRRSFTSSEDDDENVSLSDVKNNIVESEDSSEDETSSRYNHSLDFSANRRSVTDRSKQNRQSLRRTSIHSRRSIARSRHHSRRGSMRNGGDDGASVISRQSLQSISVSIKSLPREIELMDDEDEDDTRGKDDSSYFQDNGSVGSRSAASRVSRKSFVSGNRIRNRKSQRGAATSNAQRQRRPRPRHGEGIPPEIDLSGDELDGNMDVTHENASTDTLIVKEKQIVDPYGEKGVYTGALSKSTCMPNGKGRLEYEKESRWYEGDWIHGRWTGYGRLSNGDGDFYEGGLKNDHKHGTGIMRFADGRVFEGEYIRGQMIQGKMTYQDGSIYGGSWVDGMRHGRGKCIFVDGSQYEGEFREGNFHGHGKMTWNDGGWYVGNWSNGEMDGKGKEVRPDGSLRHDGEWSGGQPIRAATDNRRRRQQPMTAINGDELS